MEFVQGVKSLKKLFPHPVVTIGNFDGVHLGHKQLIDLTIKLARKRKGTAIAFTFRPHPQVALRPGSQIPLLCTYDEKIELLGQSGLDVLIEEPFSRKFSNIKPENFFNDILIKQIGAEAIIVGYDFSFGKERSGQLGLLEQLCEQAGVELRVVEPQKAKSEVVSSSRIRTHLFEGFPEKAALLLGREFFYRGVVVRGEGRGRKIGFPTANLKLDNKLTLPFGVYATWAIVDGQIYPSVTNIGVRPTFQNDDGTQLPAIIEVHLLDQTLDLYGRTLEVRFTKKLRDEKKFGGIEELKAQISKDINEGRRILDG